MLYPPESLIATGAFFAAASIILTLLRFWVRLGYSHTAIGLDDWFIVIATITVCALSATQILNTVKGSMSINSTNSKAVYIGHQIDYAQVVVEKVVYGSVKLSFLFFYRRIFNVWSTFKKLNNALIVLIIVWTFIYLICEIFQCGIHPEVQWNDVEIADQVCINHGAFLVSFAVTDVVTDLMVIGLPLFFIGRLQMSSKKKWATSAVFFLGFVSTGAGILRLIFVSVNYSLGQFMFSAPPLSSPLRVNEAINPIFWTNFECFCGVFAANLLPLWPLLRSSPKPGSYPLRARQKYSTSQGRLIDSSRDSSQQRGEFITVMLGPGSYYTRNTPYRPFGVTRE